MAHLRIARKDFIKSLGLAAAACVARPTAAAATRSGPAAAPLPMKARARNRIVARSATGA